MKFRPLILLLLGAMAANPAHALGRLADVSVIDRNSRQSLPVYYAHGTYWIAGTPGARFAVAIRNASPARVLAVASVDGVNVVSGETAAVSQVGYVLTPYQRFEITGWRKTDNEVATFNFVDAARSYAERTGRPANVGVIGIAIFREQPLPEPAVTTPPYAAAPPALDAAAKSAPLARAEGLAAPAPRSQLGTGHGERETSVVTHTEFQRASDRPDEIITLRYDTYANLVAMGVIRHPPGPVSTPNPFPSPTTPGYVPDPIG